METLIKLCSYLNLHCKFSIDNMRTNAVALDTLIGRLVGTKVKVLSHYPDGVLGAMIRSILPFPLWNLLRDPMKKRHQIASLGRVKDGGFKFAADSYTVSQRFLNF